MKKLIKPLIPYLSLALLLGLTPPLIIGVAKYCVWLWNLIF
jgi:hypothetical protein